MEFKYIAESKMLIIKLGEEIDHHTAEKARRKIDYEIQRYLPKKVIFDFSNVNFMDSAGIGLIIGRYKNISMLGGNLEISSTTEQIKRILQMSGITKLIPIIEKGDNKNEKCV